MRERVRHAQRLGLPKRNVRQVLVAIREDPVMNLVVGSHKHQLVVVVLVRTEAHFFGSSLYNQHDWYCVDGENGRGFQVCAKTAASGTQGGGGGGGVSYVGSAQTDTRCTGRIQAHWGDSRWNG